MLPSARVSDDSGVNEPVNDASEGSGRYSVRAVERVADILDTLQRADGGVSLVTLAEVTALPKSSVFRYLATLEARGYVEKDPDSGDYTLGVALPSQQRHFELLSARARPVLERFRDRFGETVNFGVLDGDRVLYLEIVESHRAMRLAARRGDRDYVHSTALGRAIAAGLPEEQVRRIVASAGMPALTTRTVTSADELIARRRARQRLRDRRRGERGGRPLRRDRAPRRARAGRHQRQRSRRAALARGRRQSRRRPGRGGDLPG